MTSPDRYAAITDLGLVIYRGCKWASPSGDSGAVIDAVAVNDLLRLIEQAPVETLVHTNYGWSTLTGGDRLGTHTGLLIGLKPLAVADSLRSIADEMFAREKRGEAFDIAPYAKRFAQVLTKGGP